MAVGLVVVGFSGDRLARRWGRGKAYWRGVVGLACSNLALVTSPVVAGTIAGPFGIGASGSLLGITIQAHLAERQQARRAQAIAELNLATSACAVLASIAIGAFERTEIGWRGALLAAAGGLLLVRLFFRHVDIDPAVPAGASHRGDGDRLPGAFWAYAAVIFLGV